MTLNMPLLRLLLLILHLLLILLGIENA